MLLLIVIVLLAIVVLVIEWISKSNTIIKLTISIISMVTIRSNVNINKTSTGTIYISSSTSSNMINDRTIINSIIMIETISIDTVHY